MKNAADVSLKLSGKSVTAFLSGEIDHHSAADLRQKIDEAVLGAEPKKLTLDFGGVTFMDSSGIGLVMGRYKLIEDTDCRFSVVNTSGHIYKVMRLAGLEKIADIKRKGETDESAQ